MMIILFGQIFELQPQDRTLSLIKRVHEDVVYVPGEKGASPQGFFQR